MRGMGVWGDVLDLILPLQCAGCGVPEVDWCDDCAARIAGSPIRVTPRVETGVPCWALAPYPGVGQSVVLALKEQHRRHLVVPLGTALAGGLRKLGAAGVLGAPPVLVPAPTRKAAARARGGDPVARFARAAAEQLPGASVAEVLTMGRGVRDSVGLSAAERQANLAGRVGCCVSRITLARHAEIVVVDDVLTTGATVAESVRALVGAGLDPVAVITLTAA